MSGTIEFKVNRLNNPIEWKDLPISSILNIDKKSPIFFQVLNFEIDRLTKELGESCVIEWSYING